jgi:SNF2 family DNA or RNA helicase
MFDVGQLVRIRERTWQVLEDHAGHSGGDHTLLVRGEDGEFRGKEFTFIYRPGSGDDEAFDEAGLEKVEALAAPELVWSPTTLPSQWERLHTAYQLSLARGSGYLLGLAGSRLVVEPYQLAPVVRVMSAPQQRFLLAEDVGMGKTIEAGLIMMELIARGRGDRILIVVPAALQDQWADELKDKFGLSDFEVLDKDFIDRNLIPRLPGGANPWYYANRVITSIDYAKQERVLRALSKTKWDLVIVDEAHYLAESGSDIRPVRTDRSRFGELIARQCDSLLLLTATPHNGYRQGFYSLLRLLDDARFASAEDMRRETIQQVVIRRSKNQIFTKEGKRKFHDRHVRPIELSINDPSMKAQRRLYEELNKYVARYWRKVKDKPNERATVGFALTLLKKRFISSPQAIRLSLQRRRKGLTGEDMAPDAGHGLLGSYQAGVALTEAQREKVERQVMVYTPEKESRALEAEMRWLDKLLDLAHRITPDEDAKTAQLKRTLDEFCLEQGRKVIVFTEYKDTLDYLYDYLITHGYTDRVAVMHGHLGREARGAQERKFHQPETKVLLATDAASEGLNFQFGCYTVIHNELPWNPNRLEQRNGRVDRWGQEHEVEIYNLILKDTLEGAILQRLQEKLEVIRKDLGSVSDVLSTTEPLDLDKLLMEGLDKHEETSLPAAIEDVYKQVEAALREGQEALDACRAQFLIAPGAFNPADYIEMEHVEELTRAALPSAEEVERFVTTTLPLLGGKVERNPDTSHLWTLTIPSSLQRTGVDAHYEQVTFSREEALKDQVRPPTIIYIAPGHPLLQGLIAVVKNDAARASIGSQLAGRMAVRVLQHTQPGILFTFLGRWQDGRGAVAAEELVPIFVRLDGTILSPEESKKLLNETALPKNAPPELLDREYKPRWLALREQAAPAAAQHCTQRAVTIANERKPELDILRHDIEDWQEARQRYIERKAQRNYEEATQQLRLFEEKEERASRLAQAAAEARRQKELQYERERIKLRREARETEIAQMEQITAVQPEAIGALVIVAAEVC